MPDNLQAWEKMTTGCGIQLGRMYPCTTTCYPCVVCSCPRNSTRKSEAKFEVSIDSSCEIAARLSQYLSRTELWRRVPSRWEGRFISCWLSDLHLEIILKSLVPTTRKYITASGKRAHASIPLKPEIFHCRPNCLWRHETFRVLHSRPR